MGGSRTDAAEAVTRELVALRQNLRERIAALETRIAQALAAPAAASLCDFGATLMPILQEVGIDPGQPMIEPVPSGIPG